MSGGIFLSMCDSTMSFFNLSVETTQTNVYKANPLIFAAIFLSICYYNGYGRIERIAQKLRALYQQQVGRTANNATFCLTRPHIGSFFRLIILMVSTALLAVGLYYSLYDDSRAAVVSFLGVAASDLTRYAFKDQENLAVLKVIESAALLLLGAGLLLLLIPHLRTTAFYSTCLGIIVRKIVLEMREVSTISYFPMDEASDEVKACSKSSDVQRDGLGISYSETSTPNEKSDETRLSTCESSRHSAASSADKEREDVNSCNIATSCNEPEQDCSVQQVRRVEDTDPVKVEKAVEQYSKSSAWYSLLSKDAYAALPTKLYLLKLCENGDSSVMKIEESSVLNDISMTSIYSNEKEQNIGQDVELETVCGGSIKYNKSPEDFVQESIAHSLQRFPFTGASIVEENQMIMEKGHSRVNSGEKVSCRENGWNLNTYENCLLQKLRPFKTSHDTKRLKQFGDEKNEDLTSMTPFEKQFLKQPDQGDDDAIKTEKPESVRLHVTETEGIVGKHTEITNEISARKTCSSENEAVPVNNLNSEEMTKQCSDCKTQYHVTSNHECILLPKKRLLKQYSAEETVQSSKSKQLTKFKSQVTSSHEPNESLEPVVPAGHFNSQPGLNGKDENFLNFQMDYFAEPGCGKSKIMASGELNMTAQSLSLKSNVDNVVNRIDLRFIYAL